MERGSGSQTFRPCHPRKLLFQIMPLKVFENLVCFKKVSGTKIQVLRREQPKSVDVESDLAMVLPPTSTRGRRTWYLPVVVATRVLSTDGSKSYPGIVPSTDTYQVHPHSYLVFLHPTTQYQGGKDNESSNYYCFIHLCSMCFPTRSCMGGENFSAIVVALHPVRS